MSKSIVSRAIWRGPRPQGQNMENAYLPEADDSIGAGGDTTIANSGANKNWSPVTDNSGYLLRRRPGWDVPVGPRAAVQLSRGFTDRDIAVLVAVEQLGMVTAEQLARAFFNTHRSAYERLLLLAQKRFLVNVGADTAIVRRALAHRPPPRNPVYALDWNGAYLLAYEHEHHLDHWRPSTAALITTRLGHNLGVSEVWSYMVAVARATHEDVHLGSQSRNLLSIALQSEKKAILSTISAQKELPGRAFDTTSRRVLLQPDAALVLAIGRSTAEAVDEQATAPASPRWSPTRESWQPALLSSMPSSEIMLASEKLTVADPSRPYFRTLLLEMETGTNKVGHAMTKIKSYNHVMRTRSEALRNAYGISPRALVVVPADSQLEVAALAWRLHYHFKQETAVLLTSLQTLARIYGGEQSDSASDRERDGRATVEAKRRAVLEQPCWLDVMADRWKSFTQVLGLE